MEAVGAAVTIAGLIGGVAKITSTINDLKSRWEYAGLSITVKSGSLWTIKAALEELVEWRSGSKDKSEKSEQLDKNIEVCVQGCAVLVAFMENRLKEFDLENLSKLDKAKIMSLDTLFQTFANDLDAQVSALKLLLTIYQCRSLAEQTEMLQQKDTRRVVRKARQSTASLMYEDKDIEDAASILSEAPSKSFEFDSIIMQHRSYSRTYPGLYQRMQHNFPSRRGSVASTIRENAARVRPNPIEDPIVMRAPDLPFLGLPFVGETAPIVESELEDQEELAYKSPVTEFPDTMVAEFPGTSTIPYTNSRSLSKTLLNDKPILAEEIGISASPSIKHIPTPTTQGELDHTSTVKESHISPVRPRSYDSLYDDSDDESVQHRPESSPQTDPALFEQDHTEDADVKGTGEKILPSASSRPGSTRTDPLTSPKPSLDEELSHPIPDTPSSQSITSEAQASSGYATPQEIVAPSLNDGLLGVADCEASSRSETTSPSTDDIGNLETSIKDGSTHLPDLKSGDEKQDRFLSGLLDFSFDHDIDLPLTPRGLLFENSESNDPQKAGQEEDNSEIKKVAGFEAIHPDIRLVPDDSTEDPVTTEDQANENSSVPIAVANFADHPIGDRSDIDSATPTTPPTLANSTSRDAKVDPPVLKRNHLIPTVRNAAGLNGTRERGITDTSNKFGPAKSLEEANREARAAGAAAMATMLAADKRSTENGTPSTQTTGRNENPVHKVTTLPDKNPNDRQSFMDYYHYTHHNDPFHHPYPQQRKDETSKLAVPDRPPPPVPSLPILLTSSEISVAGEGLLPVERSFEDGLEPLQSKIVPSSEKMLYQDGRSSFQSERSTNAQTPASPASLHSHRGTSSVTSVESSYMSRDSTSAYTQGTTVTATLPNSARIISDSSQHDKARVGITKAFSQYGQITQQPIRHRLSNLASMLNPKTASERNAKALQLAFAIRGSNAPWVLSIIQTFDKPSDISTPASIENDMHPITALMRAAKVRDTNCMDILLKHDPQTMACVDNVGQTALHHALTVSASSAVLWLIDRLSGADEVQFKGNHRIIDMKDKNGVAAVHLAARLNDVLVIEAMQKACADFGARDAHGGTVLQYAVAACSSNVVQYLIKQHLTDVNSRNVRGETALMTAVYVNDELSTSTLLENGADKSICDNNGDMAIHHAARRGMLPILELLFQSIGDVKAKNSIGEQPIHLAAAGNHVNILSALLQLPGVEVNAWTKPPHLRQPVKRAEGLAATAKLASTALHYACSAGHYEAADILLTRGAKASGNQEDGYGPLMMACQARSAAIVSLLLLHGADPKGSTATEGVTALHIAVRMDDVPCTKMLLEHGANPLARLTKSQDTPTALATGKNQLVGRNAANVCIRYQQYQQEVLKRINGVPSLTTTATQPRQTPNIRPIVPGPTLSSNPTAYQPIGMPGPQTPYFTEDQAPPPPYQA